MFYEYEILTKGEAATGSWFQKFVQFFFEAEAHHNLHEAKMSADAILDGEGDVVMVSDSGRKVVGYGTTASNLGRETVQFEAAHVHPDHTRKGIYGNLVQRRLEAAEKRGAKQVTVSAAHEFQVRFLLKNGFEIVSYDPVAGNWGLRKTL